MQIFPPLRLALLNGGLLLTAYFLGLVLTVLTFPKEKRQQLFFEPRYPREDPRWWILALGRLSAVSLVVLMFFTPLRLGTPFSIVGLVTYVAGYSTVVLSLLEYNRAPAGLPVTEGLYRLSRNPQWIGLVLVFMGSSLAVGFWLHVVLLVILVVAYHFQILLEEAACLRLYGDKYASYMDKVPRYLIFI